MRHLTETLRIEILMMIGYGDMCRSQQQVANLFNGKYPDLPPLSQATVSKIHAQFREYGHVKPLRRTPHFIDENVKVNILLAFQEDPTTSTRQVARENDVSHSTVLRCVKAEKMHPYKLQHVQELIDGDSDRRLQFCEQMLHMLNRNVISSADILFSDESTFLLNGEVNRQNCRYWAEENPHWMRQSHTQRPQKINVWAGIVGDHVVGPIFIENLNGARYLDMLREQVVPTLAELFPNPLEPNLPNERIWLQQDGAPPHYALPVRNYLNDTFPHRWIGRRGFIEWPARSPDLTPLDFFLWGYLKNRVFKTQPANLDELRNRITGEIRNITPEVLNRVREQFHSRLLKCQEVDGGHFEHL